jgi:hypothetical protein
VYEDSRGWQFTVLPGLGGNTYSVFYRKPGNYWHSVRTVPWFNTIEEARQALIDYAEKHKMTVVNG